MREFIPSTAPGKTWSVSLHKQPRRPATIFAIEGTLERAGPGIESFTTEHPGSRTARIQLDGPATAKRQAAALVAMKQLLLENGAIAHA